MIVVMKPGVTKESRDQLIHWLKNLGLDIHISEGAYQTVLGLVGDTTKVDMDLVSSLEIVDSVKRVTEPFKCCNRKFHPEDTVVEIGDVKVGKGHFCMIAGPCSVESEEQIVAVAKAVKASGADMLRGGAFKPRTSPYDFDGLKATGLELLKIARAETGLPIVSEIMSTEALPLFEDVDVLQVGARNMQNFDLLRELGKTNKPILLKRGMSGNDVRAAMLLMKDKGYYPYTIPATDKLFGPKMDAGVRKMQAEHNLGVDGIIGKNSWTYLLGK